MRDSDRRKHPRVSQNFQVKLRKEGLERSLQGTSVDLSQGGAFIKTKNWQSFKVRDHAVVAFFLPPKYAGQDKTIGLQGDAMVARVDRKNKGIGVEFTRNFKQFERINALDVASRI